ncbi:MAG: hypothetical protein GY739_12075, partial [Mesoflavibacter sp.]|nr:hypothetical protein [Mesoflavibacter sp.]
MTLKLFWIGLIALCSTTLCAVTYVSPTGSGSGQSWTYSSSLQDALSNAKHGDVLWLKAGFYTPVKCVLCTETDRGFSFIIPDGVKIYGGFNGTETRFADRDINENETILSGDINNDGLLQMNSFTVVKTLEVTDATIIDGLIITGGVADGDAQVFEYPELSGGGWYNGSLGTQFSNPKIINCKFINNRAKYFGGAVYNMASFQGQNHPTFENGSFIDEKIV